MAAGQLCAEPDPALPARLRTEAPRQRFGTCAAAAPGRRPRGTGRRRRRLSTTALRAGVGVEVVTATWWTTVVRLDGSRTRWLTVPRTWLRSFLVRLDDGSLDEVLARLCADRPERRADLPSRTMDG